MSAGRTPLPVRGWRLAHLVFLLVEGLGRVWFVFPFLTHLSRLAMMQRWCIRVLAALNLRVDTRGGPPIDRSRPALLVANHVSWLDIFVINVTCPARFVAKSEIRNWPLIGILCERAGTLFIERARRRDTGRLNEIMCAALTEGDRVAVFPEGTTSDGRVIHHFHASLLQPAVTIGAPLHPTAVRYLKPDGSVNVDAAYCGDMSLLQSMLLLVAQREVHAEVTFGQPIPTEHRKRRELAREAERAIASALSLEVAHRTLGTGDGLPVAPLTAPLPTGTRYPAPPDGLPAADRALTSARK
jgi:1-acyl-sn-glycerol-3-phosphate acyltransferase